MRSGARGSRFPIRCATCGWWAPRLRTAQTDGFGLLPRCGDRALIRRTICRLPSAPERGGLAPDPNGNITRDIAGASPRQPSGQFPGPAIELHRKAAAAGVEGCDKFAAIL